MPSVSTMKLPQRIHTAASAVDKFRRARATRLHPSHAPLLWRSCRHRDRAACILSSKSYSPAGEAGAGRGLCAVHDCRFALGRVFANEGGGQAHVDLKISSGNSSGTKVIGARKACCHPSQLRPQFIESTSKMGNHSQLQYSNSRRCWCNCGMPKQRKRKFGKAVELFRSRGRR